MTNLSQNNGTDKTRIHNAEVFTTSIEEITPEKASMWLEKNLSNNRPQTSNHIDFLANEMTAGHWRLNGEAVKFDLNNNLIDGQHRLRAVIKSGVNIISLVVRGIPTEHFYTMDTGKGRTTGNSLGFKGFKNSIVLAAAVRYVEHISNKMGKKRKASAGDTFRFINENPDIENSVSYALKLYQSSKYRGLTASRAAALHFLFSQKDSKAADKFFYDLYYGANLAADSILLILRRVLIDTGYKKTPAKVKIAYVIKAWVFIRTGRKVKQIVFNPAKDHFPVIV